MPNPIYNIFGRCVLMTAFFYIEANVMCILVSSILVYREIRNTDKRLRIIEFIKTLSIYIAFYLLEILWTLCDYGFINIGIVGKILTLFFSLTTFSYGSYQWFIYSEICQGNNGIYTKRNKRLWAIPFIVAFILSIVLLVVCLLQDRDSALTKYINIFHIIMVTIAIGYEISTAIRSFYRAKRNANSIKRGTYIFMGFSPLIFSTAIVFQSIFDEVPIFCFFNTIWFINYYLNGVDNLISIDSLTKLNNRNQLNKYFHQLPNDAHYKNYLLVIDIDGFKLINDKYGHLEGDNALVLVADSFRSVCNGYPRKIFVSRYGGDEFVILAQAKDEEDVKALKAQLNEQLDITAKKCALPYDLLISVGYTEIINKTEKLNQYIAIADKEMYREKYSKEKRDR